MTISKRVAAYHSLDSSGVLPIFYHQDPDIAVKTAAACEEGGASFFEFTNRGSNAFTTFCSLVEDCRSRRSGLILGAGSIVDAATAALFIGAGASFIVGPNFNLEIAKLCNRRKIPYVPGCATATEISQAEEAGCEFVKIFPAAELGGPSFIKALRGPMPWISVVVTGGVETNREALSQWFSAGVSVVGLGSSLFSAADIERGDFAAITQKVRTVLTTIKEIRTS